MYVTFRAVVVQRGFSVICSQQQIVQFLIIIATVIIATANIDTLYIVCIIVVVTRVFIVIQQTLLFRS